MVLFFSSQCCGWNSSPSALKQKKSAYFCFSVCSDVWSEDVSPGIWSCDHCHYVTTCTISVMSSHYLYFHHQHRRNLNELPAAALLPLGNIETGLKSVVSKFTFLSLILHNPLTKVFLVFLRSSKVTSYQALWRNNLMTCLLDLLFLGEYKVTRSLSLVTPGKLWKVLKWPVQWYDFYTIVSTEGRLKFITCRNALQAVVYR